MARIKDDLARAASGEDRLPFDPFGREEIRLANLRLNAIERDPTQPRTDLGDLEGLKASIAVHGILQPLIVSPLDRTRYLLIAGERRFTAAQQLNLTTVPALVRTVEDHQRLQVQLIENLHRKDLGPLEESKGYQRLMEEFGLNQEEVARQLGKSRPAINQSLRLLDLPLAIQQECQTSDMVSKSVLLEIVKQPAEDQLMMWQQARKGALTVKQARARKGQKQSSGTQGAEPSARSIKPIASMAFRYPIQTEEAVITVVFDRPMATQEEIVRALEEALEGEKARLKSSASG